MKRAPSVVLVVLVSGTVALAGGEPKGRACESARGAWLKGYDDTRAMMQKHMRLDETQTARERELAQGAFAEACQALTDEEVSCIARGAGRGGRGDPCAGVPRKFDEALWKLVGGKLKASRQAQTPLWVVAGSQEPEPAAPGAGTPLAAGVSLGALQVMGSIDAAAIQAVLTKNGAGLRDCYERHRASAPALQGVVAVKFIISPSGAVSTASVPRPSLSPPAPEFEACVVGLLRSWTFPRPSGGVVIVTSPFRFGEAASAP